MAWSRSKKKPFSGVYKQGILQGFLGAFEVILFDFG
jgi:hypothetical protein